MKLHLTLLFSFLIIGQACLVNGIIGGKDAEQDSFPNMASLQAYVNDPQILVHFCAGTIVNQFWILVTARCALEISPDVHPKEKVRVLVGKWNLRIFESNQQIRRVAEAYSHPNFANDVLQSYDIGLIELVTALIFNNFVKAFPLSTQVDYPSGRAITAGWGSAYMNEIMSLLPTIILQAMDVILVTRQECLNDLKRFMEEHGENFEESDISDHIFCSGSYKSITGPSFVDLGNPLMQLNESGGYEVVGVTSSCGGPTLYAHVTPYLTWIYAMTAIE